MKFQSLVVSLVCLVGYLENVLGSLIHRFDLTEPRLQAGPIYGVVYDDLGYKCAYVTSPDSPKEMTLSLVCYRRTEKVTTGYQCFYSGSPQTCDWFLKHQAEYFEKLARKISSGNKGRCNTITVSLSDCKDVTFLKTWPPYED